MIIDMHYHLDERMEPLERLLSQMDRYEIDRIVLIPRLVEPFHVEGMAEKLSNLVRKLLVGKGHRLGLAAYESTVTRNGRFSILGKTFAIDPQPDNHRIAEVMAAHPDRFHGWFFINPAKRDAVEQMESGMKANGWLGVKCHPFWHLYPISLLDDAAAYCEEKNLPLLLHLGGKTENGDFRYLPERHPGLKLIYAHGGVPHYQKLWPYIRKKENVYTDLSSPYLDESLRAAIVATLGPEKCMYGTDGPFGYPDPEDHKYNHGAILSEIDRLPLSSRQKEAILGKNFIQLAGI